MPKEVHVFLTKSSKRDDNTECWMKNSTQGCVAVVCRAGRTDDGQRILTRELRSSCHEDGCLCSSEEASNLHWKHPSTGQLIR